MKTPYNSSYYNNLYKKPFLAKLGITNLYYLWIAYFCLIKPARLKKGALVLDVGCGIGNLVWALRKLGMNAWGFEPSMGAKKLCRAPSNCIYKKTDTIPFNDYSFDLVYTNEVLEHIEESSLDRFILETASLSKRITIHMICTKERGPYAYEEPTHITIRTKDWWYKKFASLRFEVKPDNSFYFFPPHFIEVSSGRLRLKGIRSGYFLLRKNNKTQKIRLK